MQQREASNMIGHNADDRRKRDWRRAGLTGQSQAGHGVLQPPDHEQRILTMVKRAEREEPLEFGE